MTIDDYFLDLKEEYPHLESEIRGILMARAQNGSTIQDVKDDYYNLTGEKFPIHENITDFLLTIPYVTAMCNQNGTRIFNILPSEKTQHVYDMVVGQKPPPYKPPFCKPSVRNSVGSSINHNHNFNQQPQWTNNNYNSYSNRPSSVQTRSERNSSRSESEGFYENVNCFFEDNYQYLWSRFHPREEGSNNHNNLNFQCDTNNPNFASNFANPPPTFNSNMALNQQNVLVEGLFKKPTPPNPRMYTSSQGSQSPMPPATNVPDNDWCMMNNWTHGAHLFDFQLMGDDFFLYLARMELKCKFKPGEKVLQSGLCVSGQSISAATKRVLQMNYVNKRIIINLGSVDILQGKAFVQIQHDFLELLSVLRERGCQPIVTTLAPLAMYSHEKTIKERLERFNAFIKQKFTHVIDIWSCVVSEKGQTLFDCYQDKPRQITGGPEAYLFWNKIGRQRVLKKIESEIEY